MEKPIIELKLSRETSFASQRSQNDTYLGFSVERRTCWCDNYIAFEMTRSDVETLVAFLQQELKEMKD